ncbi:MAG TPA: hypothetical protein GX719_11000 [Gammaproteobacteria bacterium]|nr:hypothetical protein [Gammaproteobacteria bacterium]
MRRFDVLVEQSSDDDMRMPYLVCIAVPSAGRPAPIRALRHPWLRLSQYQQGTH